MQVAAGFDGVADGGVERLKGVGDLAVVMEQGGLGINVNGGADLRGDARGGDVFAMKLVVLVVEEVQGI
jgi:hypothetical protein